MALLMDLPQRIDRLLTHAATGIGGTEGFPLDAPPRSLTGWSLLTLMIVMTAAAVLWSVCTDLARAGVTSQPLGIAVAMAAGALIAWALERVR
jgi:hypothetical protein